MKALSPPGVCCGDHDPQKTLLGTPGEHGIYFTQGITIKCHTGILKQSSERDAINQ